MVLEESLKLWEKYGLNLKKELRVINIDDLIINLGCDKYGIKATCKDLSEGLTNKTSKPLDVIWIREENSFFLEDGYHRLVEGLLKGKKNFLCNVDWTGYTLKWIIPEHSNRFSIKKHNIKNIINEAKEIKNMKLTKTQLQNIISEEFSKVNNEQEIEEGKRLAALGLGLGMLGGLGNAKAAEPRSLSDLGMKPTMSSPSSVSQYDFAGTLKDVKTGDRFFFKKDKNKNVTLFDRDGNKIKILDRSDEGRFELMPGWTQKVPSQFLAQGSSLEENKFKITKNVLKDIIKEEIKKLL